MLVSVGVSWDLNWFLRLIFSLLFVAVGLHILLRKTASKYFEVEANFEGDNSVNSTSIMDLCGVCRKQGSKQCSRCKAVRYCSQECQLSHWRSGHKENCTISTQNEVTKHGALIAGGKKPSIALIPSKGSRTSRPIKQPKDVLFPYDDFVKLFNWDKPGPSPCGLLNCGNSCFANVVLQCLSFTRPLVAYLLEKGHRKECSCNDWCFLCEFETHVERTRLSSQSFSPMNILSRLPNIGGTLGYGRQEDAHEFMRFSIDTMQSVCLDEFGGEKVVPPNLQETTLIQHIFGGCLQSEVICTKCDQKSSQYESMMDLTVEIHGDAASLEECLDQFTAKEWLHGENMYKCDGCKDYVKAWKRLTVKRAPNILTIAFKRFQSGRFGKLNKRVAFPETLNLSPYMSEGGDGSDIYKLYAVVVHLDMLNASFFGHYICYIKDLQGKWYRVDDWKVTSVELEEVLSQGAYMLLYSRCTPRPSNLQIHTTQTSREAEIRTVKMGVEPEPTKQAERVSNMESVTCSRGEVLSSDISPELKVSGHEYQPSIIDFGAKCEHSDDVDMIDESTNAANEISCSPVGSSSIPISEAVKDFGDVDMSISPEETRGDTEEQHDIAICTPNDISCSDKHSSVSTNSPKMGDAEHVDVAKCKSLTSKDSAFYGNGYVSANKSAV
ncbi:putative ubiquitinyl hydrolase 1 [Lupinus albus]|uniref:Putative ubiquitinyl hydrolase 1 n=1 Tax=Lupinus albus TaxID=3870 RepID=A0A6A4NEG4_LUPAL|nr:putative ubiquitinyl hydrolase 1 [Lupinus albus]